MKIPKSNKKTLALLDLFKKENILQEIIIGKLLGDGSIHTCGYLNFSQCKKQEEYIQHCFDLFKNYTNYKGIKLYYNKRSGKLHPNFYFETNTIFKEYLPLWYKKEEGKKTRTKIIPENIFELLTPRSLAYWIMDDGAFNSSLMLCTHSFSAKEVNLLKTVLEQKFHLICSIKETKANTPGEFWHVLHINKESMPKLWELVGEYILPSMYYKFGRHAKVKK